MNIGGGFHESDTVTPVEELAQLVNSQTRRVFVADEEIDLRPVPGDNWVYVLELHVRTGGAAGGRIGGLGDRGVKKLYCFRKEGGSWVKALQVDDNQKLASLDLPYHAVGLTITLPDGSRKVVSGVVDRELIERYKMAIQP